MDKLKALKEQLVMAVQSQMGDIRTVDAKEMGEVIDMIKDLAETIYYCSITEAMEGGKKDKYREETRYYPQDRYYNDGGSRGYREYEYPRDITRRDPREGRSPISRRMYMESKEMHRDQSKKLQELDSYMQELSSDLFEMIADASPEEKQLLKSKISALSNKI